ncbi:hypothetical protein GIB67_039627, partial [Kingdonia uniflora]
NLGETVQTAPRRKCAPRIDFRNSKSITERTRNTTTSTTMKYPSPIIISTKDTRPKLRFRSAPQLNQQLNLTPHHTKPQSPPPNSCKKNPIINIAITNSNPPLSGLQKAGKLAIQIRLSRGKNSSKGGKIVRLYELISELRDTTTISVIVPLTPNNKQLLKSSLINYQARKRVILN